MCILVLYWDILRTRDVLLLTKRWCEVFVQVSHHFLEEVCLLFAQIALVVLVLRLSGSWEWERRGFFWFGGKNVHFGLLADQ